MYWKENAEIDHVVCLTVYSEVFTAVHRRFGCSVTAINEVAAVELT